MNIGIVSGFVSTVAIPEAIIDYILRHWYLPVLAAALFALLVVLLLRWLYVFHYYGLEGLRLGMPGGTASGWGGGVIFVISCRWFYFRSESRWHLSCLSCCWWQPLSG